MWDNTVITNTGVELIKNMMSGETIVITAVKSGTGKVSESALSKQTDVADVKQNGTVQSIKSKDNAISVSVLFENSGLAKGYTMNQIGIYAKKSDQTEILFAISQDNAGKEIPSESSMPYYSLVSNFNFSFSNDLSITSAVEPLGYVTLEAFEEHKNDTSNPHKVTKKQVGLENVPNVATNDQTVTFNDITELSTISSGDKMSTVFAKIKLAISKLITHLNSTNNPHNVTKTNVGLGNVENKSSSTIRGELTKDNVNKALGYTAVSPNDLQTATKNIGSIQSVNNGYKKIFHYSEHMSFSEDTLIGYTKKIDDEIKALGGTWNYNAICFAYCANELGVTFVPVILASGDDSGKIKLTEVKSANGRMYTSIRVHMFIMTT